MKGKGKDYALRGISIFLCILVAQFNSPCGVFVWIGVRNMLFLAS